MQFQDRIAEVREDGQSGADPADDDLLGLRAGNNETSDQDIAAGANRESGGNVREPNGRRALRFNGGNAEIQNGEKGRGPAKPGSGRYKAVA